TERCGFWCSSATAGPDASFRSPRAQESLTVTTAAVRTVLGSAIEKNVFLFVFPAAHRNGRRRSGDRGRGSLHGRGFRFSTAVPGRFIEQAQPFHQKPLGVELRGLLAGLALEVELEVSAGPAQNFEHRLTTDQGPVGGVLDLAFNDTYF